MTRVLVLAATGMLGHAVFRVLGDAAPSDVWGTVRQPACLRFFPESARARIVTGVDVLDSDALAAVIARVRPAVVINCAGIIKQLASADDPLVALPVNSLLPHRLSRLCELVNARLIHISTDCVFSGRKGHYVESDAVDATDLYGLSKHLGEVTEAHHAVTLRTSIIGHELDSRRALVDWFLSQNGRVRGYTKAIFSGLPTVELARVIRDIVLPRPELHGLYHVSAQPISKEALLRLIAPTYGKRIDIEADDTVMIDRSLNSGRFTAATGYVAADWPALIRLMHQSRTI